MKKAIPLPGLHHTIFAQNKPFVPSEFKVPDTFILLIDGTAYARIDSYNQQLISVEKQN